jgi:hypothetical protein
MAQVQVATLLPEVENLVEADLITAILPDLPTVNVAMHVSSIIRSRTKNRYLSLSAMSIRVSQDFLAKKLQL